MLEVEYRGASRRYEYGVRDVIAVGIGILLVCIRMIIGLGGTLPYSFFRYHKVFFSAEGDMKGHAVSRYNSPSADINSIMVEQTVQHAMPR